MDRWSWLLQKNLDPFGYFGPAKSEWLLGYIYYSGDTKYPSNLSRASVSFSNLISWIKKWKDRDNYPQSDVHLFHSIYSARLFGSSRTVGCWGITNLCFFPFVRDRKILCYKSILVVRTDYGLHSLVVCTWQAFGCGTLAAYVLQFELLPQGCLNF